ncbi:hypothetical protein ACFLTC_03375 [Chloroflexota bacterium]
MEYKRMMSVAVAMIGILVIAACGSDSDDVPSLRTIEDVQAAEPTVSAADEILDNEAKMMAFTQCLRDQGIDVLDPVVDSDGNVGKPELAEGVEWNKKEWGPVWESCAEHLEGFTYEKERNDLSEQVDQWVAVAACLRDKGYDLDEPTAETLEQWLGDFKTVLNWDDPAEVADYEECTGGAVGGNTGK